MNESLANRDDPHTLPATPAGGSDSAAMALASPWARLGAFVLYNAIPLAMIVAPLVRAGFIPVFQSVAAGELPEIDERMAIGAGVAMLLLLAWTILTTVFVYRNSQTVGKKLLGFQVVRSDGSRAGISRLTWLRNVVPMLPWLIPVAGTVVGLVFWVADSLFIFGRTRQCLHDRIADTIVIRA
ncbi:MAG: RDD family protein [Gammaproteobacteria bacterium]|nr:RDD family protein [Gammaproteobacteria bacterium]